jgi:hypothetical protein
MHKILPHWYKRTGFDTEGTSLINNISTISVPCRNPGLCCQQIIIELEGKKSHPVTQKLPGPNTVSLQRLDPEFLPEVTGKTSAPLSDSLPVPYDLIKTVLA